MRFCSQHWKPWSPGQKVGSINLIAGSAGGSTRTRPKCVARASLSQQVELRTCASPEMKVLDAGCIAAVFWVLMIPNSSLCQSCSKHNFRICSPIAFFSSRQPAKPCATDIFWDPTRSVATPHPCGMPRMMCWGGQALAGRYDFEGTLGGRRSALQAPCQPYQPCLLHHRQALHALLLSRANGSYAVMRTKMDTKIHCHYNR